MWEKRIMKFLAEHGSSAKIAIYEQDEMMKRYIRLTHMKPIIENLIRKGYIYREGDKYSLTGMYTLKVKRDLN